MRAATFQAVPMSSSMSALVATRTGTGYAFPSLLPAPVIPLGPVESPDAATHLPSSLLRVSPFAWSSSSSTAAIELPALFTAHEHAQSDLLLHLAVPSSSAEQPRAHPVARAESRASMHEQRQQVMLGPEMMDAAYSSRLVISLKEDSERRRQRESSQRQAQLTLSASPAQSDGDETGGSLRSVNRSGAVSADGGAAFAPPSPPSADTAASISSSSTDNVSSSMTEQSPQLAAVKGEMHSPPPAIGLLKEVDLRSSSLPTVDKLLLASPDYRFGLDDGLEEFDDLSPPAMYTPPRRGSLCGESCRKEQHEPLDALAYLHSLASTPSSSASSYQLTPTGTPSTPLTTLPNMFSGSVMVQSLTAVRATEVPDDYKSSASFRDIRALYAQRFDQRQQQQQQLERRRPNLYTVATSNTVAAAEVAALQAVQQRTIAAKLKDSNINQQPSSDSEGEAAAIIVRQPVRQQARGSKKTTSKRKRTRKRSTSTSKPSSGSSSERRRRSRDSDKENRPPQKCEQCHRRQADSGYGTGRFCGSKCARTYSINKRSNPHKQTRPPLLCTAVRGCCSECNSLTT